MENPNSPESHSIMLGQIAGIVEPWCISEECTTLDAVRLLHAEWMIATAKLTQKEIYKRYVQD